MIMRLMPPHDANALECQKKSNLLYLKMLRDFEEEKEVEEELISLLRGGIIKYD